MVAAGLAIWILVASIVTAVLYALDKRAAVKERSRVSEKTLLLWSLIGGWPGAAIAGSRVRHKTQKLSYRIKFVLCVILNVTVVCGILYWTLLK